MAFWSPKPALTAAVRGFIGQEQFLTVGFLEIDADTGVISDPSSSNVNWWRRAWQRLQLRFR